LEWKILGAFNGHFGTFMSIWCIFTPFGIFCGILVHIFGMLEQEKSGNPGALNPFSRVSCVLAEFDALLR
jgi:hypothetical protein